MPGPTNTDLYQQVGRLTGELNGVRQRLDKIDDVLERIDARLAKIEQRESARTGALVVLGGFWSAATLAIGWLAQHWWK